MTTNICGRPYVLFDPGQTAEIKRVERKNDAIDRIVNGLNEALNAVDDYVYEHSVDGALRGTVSDAIGLLLHASGLEWDEDINEAFITMGSLSEIEWKGERDLI
ncbi:hypothetical protein EEL30_15530 [Brevibacillus laterosporus]|uniref:Uncharacterized protein n=1 Tax=Brevibacillus laterosporus TaxID=1465 RepID=A0A518V9C9_BRELA|nr:hypothetical protein EEL30_15530 [Brevibacillus laterosporus]